MKKDEILQKAEELITGDREADYGEASRNFGDIARLWSVTLGVEVSPWQVAACLTQLKLARAIKTPTHADSWVDMAGYVGLAGELALLGADCGDGEMPIPEWEMELLRGNFKVGDRAYSEADFHALPIGSRVEMPMPTDGYWEKAPDGWRDSDAPCIWTDADIAKYTNPAGRTILKIGCGYIVGDTVEGRGAYDNAPKGLVVESGSLGATLTALGDGSWVYSANGVTYRRGTLTGARTVIEVP